MGQWITTEPESRCWVYLHTTGGTRRCVIRPDHHDGPCEYEAVRDAFDAESDRRDQRRRAVR